ncbi:MAG: hypothetical protein M1825_001886 [Sarcosagium campestre]|nr:MAG: hypothetical protein M1825_001886 [Sarcosagium campestre]
MASTPSHHHHHGRRLKQLLHPDGRKIHIAQSPDEAESLKRKLSTGEPAEPFDLYIHGSPEHLNTLREIHAHNEKKREELRAKNTEIYDEFEYVRLELDALSSELHMLTDHGVSLDANFSKYGYSAHLRTKNDPDSSSSSIHDSLSEKRDWEAERNKARRIVFYKKPVVRQYFHKGLLWRASEGEEVASYELFVDLLYVGIIAINGDTASEHPTGLSLLRFTITFIMSWKIWSDLQLMISWFESDDVFQRLSVLFVMACLFGLTTNIVEAFEETYSQLVAFYLTVRLFGAAYFSLLCFQLPMIRATLIGNIIVTLISSALWIGSIYVAYPRQLVLIWIAIVIDILGASLMVFLMRGTWRNIFPNIQKKLDKAFEFYPAINIEHKTERTNAFVALVFGYSVVALLYQNSAHFGINAFFGKAILGLIQAFCFNWMYFEIDGDNLFQHAIRRSIWSSFIWITMHLPFILCYVLGSAGLSRLVLAHDCRDADPHDLSEVWAERSEELKVSSGLRWYYCAGLGLALAFMALISVSHEHKDVANARIRKRHRLTVRVAVAIVLLCLPAAEDRLDSLELISVVTCLIVFALTVDLWGSSCVGTPLFGSSGKCKYTAECGMRRRDLEHAVKTGETVNVETLARNEKDEKGAWGA